MTENNDQEIYKHFTIMQPEKARLYASAMIFFSPLVTETGRPKNPQNKACVKAATKLRNMRIMFRSEQIPKLSEQNQLEILGD